MTPSKFILVELLKKRKREKKKKKNRHKREMREIAALDGLPAILIYFNLKNVSGKPSAMANITEIVINTKYTVESALTPTELTLRLTVEVS